VVLWPDHRIAPPSRPSRTRTRVLIVGWGRRATVMVAVPDPVRPRARVGTGLRHRLVDAVRLSGRDSQGRERRWSPSGVMPDAGMRVGLVPAAPRLVTG